MLSIAVLVFARLVTVLAADCVARVLVVVLQLSQFRPIVIKTLVLYLFCFCKHSLPSPIAQSSAQIEAVQLWHELSKWGSVVISPFLPQYRPQCQNVASPWAQLYQRIRLSWSPLCSSSANWACIPFLHLIHIQEQVQPVPSCWFYWCLSITFLSPLPPWQAPSNFP